MSSYINLKSIGEVRVLKDFLFHLVAAKSLERILDQQVSDQILQIVKILWLRWEYDWIFLDERFLNFRLHYCCEWILHILHFI